MGMHLLLLLVVVFGVAFATSRVELPETNVLTMRIEVDPLEQAQPRRPVQMRNVQPAPLPQTPRVKPKQPTPRAVKPEPPKQQPVKQPKKPTPEKKPVRSKPKNISTTVVKRNIGGTPSQPKATPRSQPRSNPIKIDSNAVNKLRQNLSTTSKVSFRSGAASYNRYKELVASIYQMKWNRGLPPKSASYRGKVVRVRVTVARNGSVVSARIVSRSGMVALDNSVKAALNAVRSIGQPFPPGVKEREQTFTVDFQDKR
jgi:TonB family protein